MKPYYVMVHFGGPYVDGFIVPQATDEMHALKQLRVLIWAQRKIALQRVAEGAQFSPDSESDPNRLQEIIRSLKRPWRKPGGYRTNGEKRAKPNWSKQLVVEIAELKLPCRTGFWVEDILTGHICNKGPHWRVNRPSS